MKIIRLGIVLSAAFLFLQVPEAGIVIDGKDRDWDAVGSNRWLDVSATDAGGGSHDLVELRLDEDTRNLYLFLRFAAPYSDGTPPHAVFNIDRDGKHGTGSEGYEASVVIDGAGSKGVHPRGLVRRILYADDGRERSVKTLSNSMKPDAPSHGKDFMEVSVPLSELGLKPGNAFRFFLRTGSVEPGETADFLDDDTDAETTCTWFYPSSFPFVKERPIAIDGYDSDWRLRDMVVYDSAGDAGGGPGDLISSRMASDARNLYWYASFQAPADSSRPSETTLFLDRDLNEKTGLEGCDIEIRITSPASPPSQRQGGIMLTEYLANGRILRQERIKALLQPDFPGSGSSFLETALPLRALGLKADGRIRYLVRSRVMGSDTVDWLKEFRSLHESGLYYRLGSKMAMDGNEDDWRRIRTSWLDPKGDAPDGVADLSGFSVTADNRRLFAKASFWHALAFGTDARLDLSIDSDRNASTGRNGFETILHVTPAGTDRSCPGGCARVDRFDAKGVLKSSQPVEVEMKPDAPLHGLDFFEFGVDLHKIGLAVSPRFRFTVSTGGTANNEGRDYLQNNRSADSTQLEFPKELIQVGAVAALDSSVLAEMRRSFMDGESFKRGKYFDVRLGVHLDVISFPWDMDIDSSGDFIFNFREFHEKMAIIKKSGLSISPLINFHYMPTAWDFRKRHIAQFGKDPIAKDESGRPSSFSFMPFLPYSDGYKVWGRELAIRGVREMEPYLGDQIPQVTIGNEVYYSNRDVSYDSAYTLPLWQRLHPGKPIPNPANGEFRMFRSQLLIDALKSWMQEPRRELRNRVDISTKTVPYSFSDAWYGEGGYFPHVFDYFDDAAAGAIGIDTYPPDRKLFQISYRVDKPTAVFEYGGSKGNTDAEPNRYRMAGWLWSGATEYAVRSFFAYQMLDARDGYFLHPEQKEGIRKSIQTLLEADRPPARIYVVRCLLSTKPLGAAKHDVHWKSLQGMQAIAVKAQRQYPQIGVEMGYALGGTAPDLVIRTVSDSLSLPYEEVAARRNIFLLSGKGTIVRFGAYHVRTECNASKSEGRLIDAGFCAPKDSVLMDWTQEWSNGNRDLVTDAPQGGPDSVRILAESTGGDGKELPTVIRIGKSVFISSDITYLAYGNARTSKFMADLIKKMIYDEW